MNLSWEIKGTLPQNRYKIAQNPIGSVVSEVFRYRQTDRDPVYFIYGQWSLSPICSLKVQRNKCHVQSTLSSNKYFLEKGGD